MNKKIQCIAKLLEFGMFGEFKEYILDNRLVTKEYFMTFGTSNIINKAKFLYNILHESAKEEKLMLVDYEWQFLPHEYIKVTCISEQTGKKEFTYGY